MRKHTGCSMFFCCAKICKEGISMGLGPSTKSTSLYHFNCPVVKELYAHSDITCPGVIISGVPENYCEKVFIAKRVGDLVESVEADGVIVITDGWGNHHIDFVNIIEVIGKRGIPTVGMSFLGLQGRLVYNSEYLETLIDFNKGTTGYESCCVGENHLSKLDAYKAVMILKNKIKKPIVQLSKQENFNQSKLTQFFYNITQVQFGEITEIKNEILFLSKNLPNITNYSKWIDSVKVSIISPGERSTYVNTNLDFFPIACKVSGELGEGVTHIVDGVKVMLTGVEKKTGWQPANIGSSEGKLAEKIVFNTPGTPEETDYIIGIDVLFQEEAGKDKEGIRAAHALADQLIEPIRRELKKMTSEPTRKMSYSKKKSNTQSKIVVVKIVSGLGCLYDTSVFPQQPAGYLGSYSMMEFSNLPLIVSCNQVLDGVIHSLL